MKTSQLILFTALVLSCSAQFIDDIQVFERECLGEDKFQCFSGGCISSTQYCDGIIHCEDGTDEDFCLDHHPDVELCNETHQYMCQDHKKCIPHQWICNNDTDCEDGSDEANCTTTLDVAVNATCKGFLCGDGQCISKLWVCDGRYDCEDMSDENSLDMCRHTLLSHAILDGSFCQELPSLGERNYKCIDSSYCLPSAMMCDGMRDCRDGSDEGPFCKSWNTMCSNYKCMGNNTQCSPERYGPSCICLPSLSMRKYNYTTQQCDDVNECLLEKPQCSHMCINGDGHFICKCDEGYNKDEFGYLCYATGPEAMLFFSTRNEIKFLKIKSKQLVTVATGMKQAHGVSYDGKYLYWVEAAEGHQAIVRAHLDDIPNTKEVLVGLGLEDPGDIAVDWLGGNVYFSDAERGAISACRCDGAHCATLSTDARNPRFLTLDARNGKMYWADWRHRPVIMTSAMDGSSPEILVDNMESFATGLAIDVPNDRLYYVDKTVRVVTIHGKQVYSLFEEPFHHPYSISVFENTVFWSDWTSNTIQTTDKVHGSQQKRNVLLSMDTPVFGMHIYHPVLMSSSSNPCLNNACTHFCFVTSNSTHVCGCPEGMELKMNECRHIEGYHPQYLVVGGGQRFTRIQYNTLGNPETHATYFDIGRVQATAYDSKRDTLYLYDGQRKTINHINMSDFTLGLTTLFIYTGLENVVDMDYDYVSDSLYFLDAGRRMIEVVSLRTERRAFVYRFQDDEIPISFCVMPDYGRMLVALVERGEGYSIHIDSIGLDGEERHHIIMNDLKGPHVRLRYAQDFDNVYISDEGNGIIDHVHPEGTGRENFRELSMSITSLAITDTYVFWTDRITSRLFWSDIHETTHKIRRIDLSIFPNNTQLLIQAINPHPNRNNPLLNHPCLKSQPCSDVCVQTSHPTPNQTPTQFYMGYKCLCPPGFLRMEGKCTNLTTCHENQLYCHKSNMCFDKNRKCDGKNDCTFGEDEEGCKATPDEVIINTSHILENKDSGVSLCTEMEFQCANSSICLPRSQVCDGQYDCPGGSDEDHAKCDTRTCFDTEFMCTSGSCILKTWKCDGDQDCIDGSDEINCGNITCKPGFYQCRNRECIELKRRCDSHQDCFDFSDEEDCDEPVIMEVNEVTPRCAEWEYSCELNRSICLPFTARCNMKIDCPGGTDENGCDFRCTPHGMFACKQQLLCVPMKKVCNGKKDCVDGTDETPEACAIVNKTSLLYPPRLYPAAECHDGFLCGNGQCVEWREVCDRTANCFDGTDEMGHCSTACENHTCSHTCQPTPAGPHCVCPPGYQTAADRRTCFDVNECEARVCSHHCFNLPGSYLCSCHYGYALRADRRSCKAVIGHMSILYVSGNTVRSISADGYGAVEYNDPEIASISGMDFNIKENKLYVTSAESGRLIEVNGTHDVIAVTNIGRPNKVAVDWVTGNVYFVDKTPGASYFRVCDVRKKRCAKLQRLASDAEVSAVALDPMARRMFYCVSQATGAAATREGALWTASLGGRGARALAATRRCTGLALDSFEHALYLAETAPARLLRMDYTGGDIKNLASETPHLEAPHGLALFEDHIYYLVANSFRLSRCVLFGPSHCETYIYRVFDANTFVIRHQSVQRDNVKNHCEGVVCSNVCVLDETGPKCICDDGSYAKDGVCELVKKTELPLFNGWTYQDYLRAHHVSFTVITAVLILLFLYLCLFVYYHFVYRPRRNRQTAYTEVRYQNNSADDALIPTVEMTADGSTAHEFVNPLQYMRNMWHQSFRRQNRPIYTNGMAIDMPNSPHQDFSDTESDFDDRQKKKIIRKTNY